MRSSSHGGSISLISSNLEHFTLKDTVITDSQTTASSGRGGGTYTEGIGEGEYSNLCLTNTRSTWAGQGMCTYTSTGNQTFELCSLYATPLNGNGANNFVFVNDNQKDTLETQNNYSNSQFSGGNMIIAWYCHNVFVEYVTLASNTGFCPFNDEGPNDLFAYKAINVVKNTQSGYYNTVFHPSGSRKMEFGRAIFIENQYTVFNGDGVVLKDCLFFGNQFETEPKAETTPFTNTLVHASDWKCLTNHERFTLRVKKKGLELNKKVFLEALMSSE